MYSKGKIPFAKSMKTGKMVSVFDVNRGRACDCICPECKVPVEACKGPIRYYFRHEKHAQSSEICRNPFETAVHETAKELIKEGSTIWLPAKEIDYLNQVEPIYFGKEGYYEIEKSESEKWQNGFRPDITIQIDGKPVYIEITVTHKIDDLKLTKIVCRGIPTLEIDLSSYAYEDSFKVNDLHDHLLGKNSKKKWAYYNQESYTFEQNMSKARRLFTAVNEDEYLVNGCPYEYEIMARGDEKSWEQCGKCIYCASIDRFEGESGGSITCTAVLGLSLKDKTLDKKSIDESINAKRKDRKLARKRKQEAEAALREAERIEINKWRQTSQENRVEGLQKPVEKNQIKKRNTALVDYEMIERISASFRAGTPIVPFTNKTYPTGDTQCPKTGVQIKLLYDGLLMCRKCKYCGYFEYYKENSIFKSSCCYPFISSKGENIPHHID